MKRVITWILLIAFVLSGLAAAVLAETPGAIKIAPPAPKFTDAERQAELASRRTAVASKMADGSVLILFSAEPKLYTNDVDYVYRQENNLFYLTGLKQNGATLIIAKNGSNVSETLFLPKRIPVREAWEGNMYSREEASRISGLKTLIDASERDAFFQSLKDKKAFSSTDGTTSLTLGAATLYLLLPSDEKDVNGKREFRVESEFKKELAGYKIYNAQPIFAELRHIKSPYELRLLQYAIDITTEAQMRSMAMVGRAAWEYQVHAEVEYTFRRRNADFWGYPSIVGCGVNATTLHYVESQSEVRKGNLLLMDVGAEYDHYTADVTRTYPVNGKFTKEQAEIYQIVYDAQEAVGKAAKPGVAFSALQATANKVLEAGLLRLGLIDKADGRQFRLFAIHGLGHWLGMNVHDVGDYTAPLKPGMVFTNEPGLYFREDALNYLPDTPETKAFLAKIRPVYEKYKGIGVRIEDDLLVTGTGVEWMTKALPRKLEDIETFMANAPKGLAYTAAVSPNIFIDQTFAGNSRDLHALFTYPQGVTMRSGFVH
ncbi:MAG: aminopeptidase P family protein [Pyrinomonadaceae bacterium]